MIRTKIKNTISYLQLFTELTVLILGFLVYKSLKFVLKIVPGKAKERFSSWALKKYQNIADKLERDGHNSITRLSLIDLSIHNLSVKKSRTLITVGGMAVGIGSIVFLVSIGYGLQELVVSRVARLEELKQTDVISQPNSELKLNDEALAKFNNLTEVEEVLPLISVVGKISYNQAVTDMAVYGVTSQYLKKSAITPVKGSVFESDDLARIIFEPEGAVAWEETKADFTEDEEAEVLGESVERAKYLEQIRDVRVKMEPELWLRVRSEPTTSAPIIGYTKRPEGQLVGVEIWGGDYEGEMGELGIDQQGSTLGKWVACEVFLWQKTEEGFVPWLGEQDEQIQQLGYIGELGMEVEALETGNRTGQVLGDSDESGVDWVEIASQSAETEKEEVKRISLGDNSKKEAVVNRAVLSVLGIDEADAIGESFEASFVVMGKDLDRQGEKIESEKSSYKIVGVIPGDKVPLLYVPFLDLRSLGIVNYSQTKLVTKDKDSLPIAREKVEAIGFVTRSVVDTVDQIESIFATTRVILGLLGMAALLVASLGMFNTLTVSLLERTREVGLMKALGMKSAEVKELFLIESLTMGLLGGIVGIGLGFAAGKIVSLILTIFAVARGVGVIDISLIPISFIALIVFLAIFVGIVTGLYPAKRARQISALNALRYE